MLGTVLVIGKTKVNKTTGSPCGPVVKNLPTNAGDTGSIPGQGRSHIPQGSLAGVPKQFSQKQINKSLKKKKKDQYKPYLQRVNFANLM